MEQCNTWMTYNWNKTLALQWKYEYDSSNDHLRSFFQNYDWEDIFPLSVWEESLLCLQLYIAMGHYWRTLKISLIFSNFCQYPIAIGLERALSCNDIFHWIQHGRHPRRLLMRLRGAFSGEAPVKYQMENAAGEPVKQSENDKHTIKTAENIYEDPDNGSAEVVNYQL